MKRFACLSLIVLCSFASAQKPSDWRKAGIAPQTFAKNVDGALLKLKNAHCAAHYELRLPPDRRGWANLDIKIRDRKTFKIEAVKLDPSGESPLVSQYLLGNKGRFFTFEQVVGFKKLTAGADTGFLKPSQSYLKAWPQGFPRIAFQTYFTGKGAFSSLVTELLKPNSGYSVSVEKRTMQGGGRSIPQARILAVRKASLVKKLGTSVIEIIVDTDLWLPLQMRCTEEKKGRSFFEWTGAWNGPAKFEDSIFKVPG